MYLERASVDVENEAVLACATLRKEESFNLRNEVAENNIYRVKRGDTAYRIAKENGVDIPWLQAQNPHISNINTLKIGTILVVRPKAGVHRVKPGDTLWSIAQENKTTVQILKQINGFPLKGTPIIRIGQSIRVSGKNPSIQVKPVQSKEKEISLSEFTDKGIKFNVLEQLLRKNPKEPQVFDKNGNRIIYVVPDSKTSRNVPIRAKLNRRHIAVHATASPITRSALNGLNGKMYKGLLIAENGAIIQIGTKAHLSGTQGALGKVANRNGFSVLNKQTIPIEIQCKEDRGDKYWTERPSVIQMEATKEAILYLKKMFPTIQNTFTSGDPVTDPRTNRYIRGCHIDNYYPNEREIMGIDSWDNFKRKFHSDIESLVRRE